MKFCTNCGNKLEDNDKFCHYCGSNIKSKTTAKKEETKRKNDNYKLPSLAKRVLALVLSIFLGFIGAQDFYYGYYDKGIFKVILFICSLGLLSPVIEFLSIIEGILMLIGLYRPRVNIYK